MFSPVLEILAKNPNTIWTSGCGYFIFLLSPCLRLVKILLSTSTPLGCRLRPVQAALSAGGWEGAHWRLCGVQPQMRRRCDMTSWIWLAPARHSRQKEGQKATSPASRGVTAPGCQKGNEHCAPRASAPEQCLPEPLPERECHLCSCFPSQVWAAQRELAGFCSALHQR